MTTIISLGTDLGGLDKGLDQGPVIPAIHQLFNDKSALTLMDLLFGSDI